MDRQAIFDVNKLWFYLVMLYLTSSLCVSLLGANVHIGFAALWGCLLYYNRHKRIGYVILGFVINEVVLAGGLPPDYQTQLLRSEIIAAAMYLYGRREGIHNMFSYCKVRMIAAKYWIAFPILTALLFVIAAYFNALSLLVFHNFVSDSLQTAAAFLPQSILILAVVPAVMEEWIYRGCIYQSIHGKKRAIIVSSVLFALMHFNFNQMSYAFVIGMLFAVIVAVTDNITFTVILHMLFNMFNLLLPAMEKLPGISHVLNSKIGCYYPFGPDLTFHHGENIWIGLVVVMISLLLIGGILYLMRPVRIHTGYRKEAAAGENEDWKPDPLFGAGCLVCLIMAAFSEIAG